MFSLKPFGHVRAFCVLILLFVCTSVIFAAEETSVMKSKVGSINKLLQQKIFSRAQTELDEFWTQHRSDADFLEAVRQIKDVYWQEADHAAHYALCDRIIREFPYHPLAVATSADVVRGYIYDNDLAKTAEKLEEFWTYGYSDEHFLEYARQIKDLYWEKKEYTAHDALCDRIIKEFPNHTLGVATRADVVRGYIYNDNLDKAAEKLDEFWAYGHSDENFLKYARLIKDAYWQKNEHAAHFALCDRIINEFPDDPLAVATRADVVWAYIDDKNLAKASEKLEEFWAHDYLNEKFVEYARNIKDKYWQEEEHAAHFALCDRIINEFPSHTLAVATSADVVRGYIYNNDLDKAAEKMEEFWAYGQMDEHFLEYARQIKDLYWEKKEYTAHYALCNRIITEFPSHPLAVATRADVVRGYIYNNDLEKAAEELEAFWAHDRLADRFLEYARQIKTLYWEQKDYAEHFALCERIIKEFPDDPLVMDTRRDIITGYIKCDELPKAEEVLTQFIEDYRSDERLVGHLDTIANVCKDKRYYQKAEELAQWYIDQHPDADNAITYRDSIIRANLAAGKTEVARKELAAMAAFKDDPEYISRMHELGGEFAKKKDYSTGLQIYADLKNQYPNYERAPGFQRSVIQIYLEMGDEDAVGRELDVFFADYAEYPEFVEQAQQLAADFDSRKETDWAIEVYAGLLDTLPEHDQAIRFHAGLTKAYIQKRAMEQSDELVELLERDYKTRSDYAEVINDLGDSYRVQKEFAKAINLYRKTLAAESSQSDGLSAYIGIAKATSRLTDNFIDPNELTNVIDPNRMSNDLVIENNFNIPDVNEIMNILVTDYDDVHGLYDELTGLAEDFFAAYKYEYAKKVALEIIEHETGTSHAGDCAYMIAHCARKLEDQATQLEYYHIVMEKYPQCALAYRVPNELGLLYIEQGNYEQAEYWYLKQRELYNDEYYGSRSTFDLGVMYTQATGEYAKALEVFENYIRWYPRGVDMGDLQAQLALCYDKLGNKEKALAILREALENKKYEGYADVYNEVINHIQKGATHGE